MDEVEDQSVAAAVPAADKGIAAGTAATEETPRELSINELEKRDDLLPAAAEFNLQCKFDLSPTVRVLDVFHQLDAMP